MLFPCFCVHQTLIEIIQIAHCSQLQSVHVLTDVNCFLSNVALVQVRLKNQRKNMSLKLVCENLFSKLKPIKLKHVTTSTSNFHTTAIAAGKINRMKDRTAMLRTVVKKEDGTRGEKSVDVDSLISRFVLHWIKCGMNEIINCLFQFSQQFQRFPDIGLPERLFGEVSFKDLHICHIRVSKNNTIVDVTDSKGKILALNSCGKEGYKNCRKGTNIAGQATAITLAKVIQEKNKHIHTEVIQMLIRIIF